MLEDQSTIVTNKIPMDKFKRFAIKCMEKKVRTQIPPKDFSEAYGD